MHLQHSGREVKVHYHNQEIWLKATLLSRNDGEGEGGCSLLGDLSIKIYAKCPPPFLFEGNLDRMQ